MPPQRTKCDLTGVCKCDKDIVTLRPSTASTCHKAKKPFSNEGLLLEAFGSVTRAIGVAINNLMFDCFK